MEQSSENQFINSEENNLREQLERYLIHWKWFVLAVILALVGAFLYLRYSTSTYSTTATILVKDEDRGGGLSESAILEDLGSVPSFSTVNVEDELGVLKSKTLMTRVVKDLSLSIEYFAEGKIKTSELYHSSPFQFKFIGKDSLNDSGRIATLNFEPISKNKFNLKSIGDSDFKEFNFGELIEMGFGKFVITPDQENYQEDWISKNYVIRVTPVFLTVSKYQSLLNLENEGRRSSIINLKMESSVPNKSEDILNNLIYQFNNDAISDKNLISENTSKFIAERLKIIEEELDSVETKKENFKTENRLTDIPAEAKLFLEEDREVQMQRLDVETRIELINNVISYLTDGSRNSDLLPANLGLDENGLANSISEYNELVLERDRQLQFGTELNPVVSTLTSQINDLRAIILEGLQNTRRSLGITLNEIKGQQSKIDARISSVPAKEKVFRDIDRQQQIKETLFLYLLQKREETAISLAITAPVAKVVDAAYTNRVPVSPKRKIIYLAALILGLLVPFLVIYVYYLLDTKIHNKSDIEKFTKHIPILGEVPKIDSKESETIQTNDRSVLAEAFRILRTNLSYFVKTKDRDSSNVIYVTSTIKGEGKTFVAFNLALTLASSEKKVLIIGADIRNPQLHRYIDKPEQSKGLSEYLYDDKVTIESITNKYDVNRKEVDILLSGRIPPNPAELLMKSRMQTLIEETKSKYDYVVVDTAPTMLVTDTLLISQYADFTVYVTRAEYTEKKLLGFPAELFEENKLKNMAFVVNNVNASNYGYGNKYGYGYGVEQDSFWTKFKKAVGLMK